MTTPDWLHPAYGGSLRWLEFAYTVVFEIFVADAVFVYVRAQQLEESLRRDCQSHAQAQLQRNETLRIVSNFLPEKVLQAMKCGPVQKKMPAPFTVT